MKDLKKQLKDLKNNDQLRPDSFWISNNKRTLLNQIKSQETKIEKYTASEQSRFSSMVNIFVPQRIAFIAKPALTFVLIIAVATSGWALTASASGSVKGDFLYSAKRAAEDITVAVTPDKKKKAELHLAHATKRSQEAKKIVEEKKPESQKLAEETLTDLKASVVLAKEVVEDAKTEAGEEQGNEELVEELVEVAKSVSEKTEALADDLVGTAKAAEESGVSLEKEVLDATNEVNKAGLEAVVAVIEAQAGDPSLSSEEVQETQEMMEKKMVKILTGADDAIAETDKVKEMAEQAQDVLEEGEIAEGDEAEQTIEEIKNVSSTEVVVELETQELIVEIIEVVVDEIVKEAGENKTQVTEKVEELKVLLGQNQITEALEKAKELQEVIVDSQSVSIEAKKVVEVVLPTEESNEIVPVETENVGGDIINEVDARNSEEEQNIG